MCFALHGLVLVVHIPFLSILGLHDSDHAGHGFSLVFLTDIVWALDIPSFSMLPRIHREYEALRYLMYICM
jgi:hypothetical protein